MHREAQALDGQQQVLEALEVVLQTKQGGEWQSAVSASQRACGEATAEHPLTPPRATRCAHLHVHQDFVQHAFIIGRAQGWVQQGFGCRLDLDELLQVSVPPVGVQHQRKAAVGLPDLFLCGLHKSRCTNLWQLVPGNLCCFRRLRLGLRRRHPTMQRLPCPPATLHCRGCSPAVKFRRRNGGQLRLQNGTPPSCLTKMSTRRTWYRVGPSKQGAPCEGIGAGLGRWRWVSFCKLSR